MRNLEAIPPHHAKAQFAPDFGTRFIVSIEVQDLHDQARAGCTDDQITRIAEFQTFAEEEGFSPVWLLDDGCARSPAAQKVLSDPLANGKAELGLLWRSSRATGQIAQEHLLASLESFKAALNTTPQIFRAARCRPGPADFQLLADQGVAIDMSACPLYDLAAIGGYNFRSHPITPYWLDEAQTLLELPQTATYWGMLRRQGGFIQPRIEHNPALCQAIDKLGILERIPLTPEGTSVEEAIRCIDMALDDGVFLLILSFNAGALAPGLTSHTGNEAELELFHDWWLRVLAYLDLRGVRSTSVQEILNKVICP